MSTSEKSLVSKVNETDKMVEIKTRINATQIALEVFHNLPECSVSLSCVSCKYGDKDQSKFEFKFVDLEDDYVNPKKYTVTLPMAEKGVVMVIEQVLAGKLFVGGLETLEDLMDLGNWDAEVVDAAVQCAIFGEVIYG